ncbi:MAG TPA: hypothetical protein DCR10_09950 [Acidimicrobiaceae bacterium]|nr:hypothetical protein [Acidimicrobiaceae bacterium]|tara:strand:+ start:211 stop:750 length:540 start_codon:yes stop_codon:yes gene_type:complete
MSVEEASDDIGLLLQGLKAKEEIRELVVRYGLAVDGKDSEILESIFTDDVKFHAANGEFSFEGSAVLIEFFLTAVAAADRNSLHVTHGHIIDLDPANPDRASGVLFGHAELIPGDPTQSPKLAALRYDDKYRRVDGVWRFSERLLSFFYRVDAKTYAQDIMSETPVRGGEVPLPADFYF